ncbi:nucleoside ABC transporter membrane protein [Litoreibacter ascidiaceicola]|uniref:Nucleoside ABC transporter membrane protein n=1 Tax=Litoreibacter ascidiaceicola TaxID=1486859 RepID=A0A1M4ZA01_9RHOB|nr:ABC transporter permease [Litoreibacter ascidiaceicola]SHF14627.1 nucleoside ABC transporter membrane protein [Litoreibacter ascidiaceicola]
MEQLPKWADLIVVPLVGLILAFSLSMLMVFATGHDPMDALSLMVKGALGSTYGWGYTLYYATNFIFTGLAVAVAFHASLFNIGGEGQAAIGGLGVALVCLFIPWPHWTIALVAATAAAGLFGALWALIPAYLQAKRGSHIVITTIMFNFIAASLLNYVLVNKLRPKGSMDPATAKFPEPAHLPSLGDMLNAVGIPFAKGTPANVTLVVALVACIFVYYLIWRTRLGYQLRAFGKSQPAAVYAGINPVKITIITMMISGALAGLMAINNVMGEAERLILGSVEGAGFIGIAVALMGRSHPLGILFAALLFGALYQGGAELGLWTSIPRELVIVIQALVILFTGALDNMVRSMVAKVLVRPKRAEA